MRFHDPGVRARRRISIRRIELSNARYCSARQTRVICNVRDHHDTKQRRNLARRQLCRATILSESLRVGLCAKQHVCAVERDLRGSADSGCGRFGHSAGSWSFSSERSFWSVGFAACRCNCSKDSERPQIDSHHSGIVSVFIVIQVSSVRDRQCRATDSSTSFAPH